MKKLMILILLSAWPASLWAQTDLDTNQRWVEQIDGSFSFPAYGSSQETNPGFGGDINVGYRFSRNLALFAGSGYYQYDVPNPQSGPQNQLAYIPLVGIIRLTFGDGPIHPYALFGAGIAMNTYTRNNPPGSPVLKTSQAETDFYMAPGLGMLFSISSGMAVFIQSRVDLDYTTYSGLGNPAVFIPVQAGISFLAL